MCVGEVAAAGVRQLRERDGACTHLRAHRLLRQLCGCHRAFGTGSGLNAVVGDDVGVNRDAQLLHPVARGHADVVLAASEHVDADAVAKRNLIGRIEAANFSQYARECRFQVAGHGIDRDCLYRCQCGCARLFGGERATVNHLRRTGATAVGDHRCNRLGTQRDFSNRLGDRIFDRRQLISAHGARYDVCGAVERIGHKHDLERAVPSGNRAAQIARARRCETRQRCVGGARAKTLLLGRVSGQRTRQHLPCRRAVVKTSVRRVCGGHIVGGGGERREGRLIVHDGVERRVDLRGIAVVSRIDRFARFAVFVHQAVHVVTVFVRHHFTQILRRRLEKIGAHTATHAIAAHGCV